MYNKLCNHTFQLFFAEQFFKLFDKDRSGTISLSELIDGLNMLMEGTDMDKLKFLFDVYDVDGKTIIFFPLITNIVRFLFTILFRFNDVCRS